MSLWKITPCDVTNVKILSAMRIRTLAGSHTPFVFLALLLGLLTVASLDLFSAPVETEAPHPAKGAFLIADPKMFDPRFKETVILITHAEPSGAVGIIVNRPTEMTLAHAFPGVEAFESRQDVLYVGGPVLQDRVVLLLRTERRSSLFERVFDNVYFGQRVESFQEIAGDPKDGEAVRVYAGHAGWSPGQLEREIEHGWWRVIRADSGAIFDMEPSSLWQEMMALSTRKWI
jgi:putative transcriptional regulator